MKYIFVDDLKSLIEIADSIGQIYKENVQPRTRCYYSVLCQRYADLSERILKSGTITFIIFYVIFMILIIGGSISMGQIRPSLEVHFPKIDENTTSGLAFLIVFNILIGAGGLFIVCSYDLLLFIIFANMLMVSSIIIGHLNELKDALLDPKCQTLEAKTRLLNIILMHKKYNE